MTDDGPPIDREKIESGARLLAIEYLLAELFRLVYELRGASPAAIVRSHEELRQALRTMRVPHPDPAVADLLAQEFEQACSALLQKIANSALK